MKEPSIILALVTDAFGGRGGIAQYNRDFLGAVVEQGVDGNSRTTTVLPRHAPDREVPPSGVRQLPAISSRIAYSLNAVATALRLRTNIVFCGHLYMAPLAMLIARLTGASLVVQMHGIEAWQPPSRLQRRAVNEADLVLCVSRYTRARVLAWADVPPECVLVLPNTVRESFTPGDGSSLRGSLGLEEKKVLLTVGRLDPSERYKGHDLVISAMPKLVAMGHDAVYVVVGDGGDRPRLEALAGDLEVSDRVRFLGGIEPPLLMEAYRMADVFVMPSTGEGFGIAFLEAMACGTSAIGLRAGGARDALADGDLGTVTTTRELSDVIADRLRRGADEPARLAEAVRIRFGKEAFRTNVRRVIGRLREAV